MTFRSLILIWLSFWWLSTQAAAQNRVIFIATDPPGARIVGPYGDLGTSGGNVVVDTRSYGTNIKVTFVLDGYLNKSDYIVLDSNSARWPEGDRGPLKLEPTWATWSKQHIPHAVGVLSLLLAMGWWAGGQRRKIGQLQVREELLDSLDRSDSLVSMVLGNYRLLNRLGKGGMATVYLGVPEQTLDRAEAVAVKVLNRDLGGDPQFVARLQREARVTRDLDHPNIMRLIDWGEEKGFAYLVVELIEGGCLRERLTGFPLELEEAWEALEPLCAAVSYAHSRRVVHRDLKPENILITGTGVLKVSDFGLARTENQDRITATGATLGTPAYMAPEQIMGAEPHPAMDQYAIGVIAFELLTGRVPFSAPDAVQMIFMTMSDEPPPPSQFRPLAAEVDQVILKMLAKKPEQRHPSLSEAADALRHVLSPATPA